MFLFVFIPPNKGLAHKTLYSGQYTLSTHLIKANYLLILPTDAIPQILWKLAPFTFILLLLELVVGIEGGKSRLKGHYRGEEIGKMERKLEVFERRNSLKEYKKTLILQSNGILLRVRYSGLAIKFLFCFSLYSAYGVVPFLKDILGRMLPMMGMAKQDNLKWVIANCKSKS